MASSSWTRTGPRNPLLAAALAALAAEAAGATFCGSAPPPECGEPYLWWRDGVKAGERGFRLYAGSNHVDFTCMAKGSAAPDEMLDPASTSNMNLGQFQQQSKMPCEALNGLQGGGDGRRRRRRRR